MTDFTATSVLEITGIKDDSLRSARDQIEDELGGISVDVQTAAGGRSRGRGRGGGLGAAGDVGAVEQMMDQTEILEDIHDELEKLGQSGVGGGGAGGALGGGGAGGGATGGLLGGLLGGGAVLAGGIAGGVGAGIAGSRFALGQGLLGSEGKQTIQGRKQFEGLSGLQNAASNPLGFVGSGAVNAIDPTGLGETGARKAGAAAVGKAEDVAPNLVENQRRVGNAFKEGGIEGALDVDVSQPQWAQNLGDNISEPKWIGTLDSATDISEPEWVGTLDSALSKTIDIETPDWIDSLNGVGVNLNVDIPSPQLDLGTGTLKSELDKAFDDFEDDVIDDVVDEVESQFTDVFD